MYIWVYKPWIFVGVVYYTLGNICPKYRSQLDAIQLLAVATYPVIKKYGIDAILEPFLDDLQFLEQVSTFALIIVNSYITNSKSLDYNAGNKIIFLLTCLR